MADENENVEGIKFQPASYMCDEFGKDGFIRVTVWIPGLKTSTAFTFEGFLPTLVRKPDNAEINVVFEERSFCMTMVGKSGELKWINKRLKIKKLLHEIVPEESYYKVDKKERIIMFLRKKEDISWMPGMDRGLQCMDEGEEEGKSRGKQKKQLHNIREGDEDENGGGEDDAEEEESADDDDVEGIHLGVKAEGEESEDDDDNEDDEPKEEEEEEEGHIEEEQVEDEENGESGEVEVENDKETEDCEGGVEEGVIDVVEDEG